MPLLDSPWVYLIVLAAVAVDGFIPIVPSEVLVIGLGAMSATGRPNVIALAAAVIAGGMAGDRISYALGRRTGRWIKSGKLAHAKTRAEQALARHGGAAILLGRFLPYGRLATALTAGSVAFPARSFRLHTALAGAAWAAYAIGLGRLGGATFEHAPFLGAALGIGLGLLLGAVHTLVSRRRPTRSAAPAAVPAAAPAPERELMSVGPR
ncbi:hypothetical protein GCM10010172_47510 [Paractinoplanes ferrugineus]|uniref:VTT domain-containing protein n=2 Tax=Paractinoplanes ferrugineus TaxID=113564 RepID=A0A919MF93_9ACTN|nr:hypothetical protein Afe05nite_21750 [Actinoplanes ferrugineus]